jgi:hypothetical protein
MADFGRGRPCDCYQLGKVAEALSAYPGHISNWVSIGGDVYFSQALDRLGDLYKRLAHLWEVLPVDYEGAILSINAALGRMAGLLQAIKSERDPLRRSSTQEAAERLAEDLASSCMGLATTLMRMCC